MSEEKASLHLFRGGGVQRLLERLRLVGQGEHRPGRRLLLVFSVAWLPLVILSALEGTLVGEAVELPLLRALEVHVRFLVAVPLLLLAEEVVDLRVFAFVDYLESSALIAPEDVGRWHSVLARARRWNESAIADLGVALVAWGLSLAQLLLLEPKVEGGYLASSWLWKQEPAGLRASLAGLWYAGLSLPIYLAALLRCLGRYGLWVWVLSRLSRLRLELRCAHPDLAGGLGLVRGTQVGFVALFVAMATVLSATMAQRTFATGAAVSQNAMTILLFGALAAAAQLLPLLFFVPPLVKAKWKTTIEYTDAGRRLSGELQTRWLGAAGPALLDSSAPSTLADFGSVFDNVARTNPLLVNSRAALTAVVLPLVPFAPLWLIGKSLQEVLVRLARILG